MVSALQAVESHRRMISAVGEEVLVRRFTGSGSPRPKADTATMARVMGYQPNQLVGSIVQGDVKVIALVDTLASLLPLTTADKVVVRGKELAIKGIDANTRRIGGTLIALEIQAGG